MRLYHAKLKLRNIICSFLADGYTAILKQHVWRHIKQGNKATTPKKFAQALVSGKMVSNVVVFEGHVSNLHKPPSVSEMKGVTTFNDFTFETECYIFMSIYLYTVDLYSLMKCPPEYQQNPTDKQDLILQPLIIK